MTDHKRVLQNPVLVVDDDPDTLDEMADALRDYGLVVYQAGSGEEALPMAEKHQPTFVIMDYHMPGINGLETISAMKTHMPEAVFIIVTGIDAFCNLETIENTQVYSILLKPISMDVVARFICTRLDYRHTFPFSGNELKEQP